MCELRWGPVNKPMGEDVSIFSSYNIIFVVFPALVEILRTIANSTGFPPMPVTCPHVLQLLAKLRVSQLPANSGSRRSRNFLNNRATPLIVHKMVTMVANLKEVSPSSLDFWRFCTPVIGVITHADAHVPLNSRCSGDLANPLPPAFGVLRYTHPTMPIPIPRAKPTTRTHTQSA